MPPPRAVNAAGKGALLLPGSGWGAGRSKTGSRWQTVQTRTRVDLTSRPLQPRGGVFALAAVGRWWGEDFWLLPPSSSSPSSSACARACVCACPSPSQQCPLFRSAFHMFSWSGAIIHVCLRLNYSLKALQIWRFSRFVNNSRLLTAPWTAAVNGLLSLRRRFMISILSSLPWYYCGKLMKNAKPCLNQYTTQSTTFFRNVFYIPVSLYESQHKLSLCISFVQWLEKNFKLFQPCFMACPKSGSWP